VPLGHTTCLHGAAHPGRLCTRYSGEGKHDDCRGGDVRDAHSNPNSRRRDHPRKCGPLHGLSSNKEATTVRIRGAALLFSAQSGF
jgi:hypothetical protein